MTMTMTMTMTTTTPTTAYPYQPTLDEAEEAIKRRPAKERYEVVGKFLNRAPLRAPFGVCGSTGKCIVAHLMLDANPEIEQIDVFPDPEYKNHLAEGTYDGHFDYRDASGMHVGVPLALDLNVLASEFDELGRRRINALPVEKGYASADAGYYAPGRVEMQEIFARAKRAYQDLLDAGFQKQFDNAS